MILGLYSRIMKLGSFPSEEVDILSKSVHDLIMACLAPENEASSTFTLGYCVLRALAREPSLENGLPMLPLHAVAILQWLRNHFYADGELKFYTLYKCRTSAVLEIDSQISSWRCWNQIFSLGLNLNLVCPG